MLMGIKKPKPISNTALLSHSEKLGIPLSETYVLDTAYRSFMTSVAANDARKLKDHLQPLQALYFSRGNQLSPIAWYVNCYAPGFPQLKWNDDGGMDQFPPRTQAPPDSLLSLTALLRLIRPVEGKANVNISTADYTIVIFWNRFMEKQSRGLLEAVRKNLSLAGANQTRLLYVNNDAIFAY
jgi:hypothetical protein